MGFGTEVGWNVSKSANINWSRSERQGGVPGSSGGAGDGFKN